MNHIYRNYIKYEFSFSIFETDKIIGDPYIIISNNLFKFNNYFIILGIMITCMYNNSKIRKLFNSGIIRYEWDTDKQITRRNRVTGPDKLI